ncbi:anti-sigma regulatory factor [Anabaena cylindrica FACHB-243]|uniref:Anti-sigma regulatory factor, serine/threonine protein kinase n=1 Tax=Anabaena cylindrica (strain ATCC 27899 / PCC 7122) TaxID=272123 RepID=K9ZNU3_ANACC|nr:MULTISPECIES: anti-sigma regulatory factor [Anabaena]AFZ60871.1 putative anti-sigma regulatory factor, serine/threonine protein kinase [Anabaena cylindrica PCC 7122]MBD2420509.1 anti-sigma regulatory factor [Anabaena cylindrica FACHB-243]MBY5284651.1 anti-sigma regulatory factor [Anabaena sp. CCAP 1446/1C]MBY5309714.1 anti-sigma regulatory factor [Anabaena sp. CCAP 1446/1C]MCM2406866.1 anti-sigma regulatory factor [Anabaena sp. CCAP 1446/1C]
MITISLRPVGRNWGTISFASTLYLCPILDLLLADVPTKLQAELRLGLQEALVNAAKHGNNLDPGKLVVVRFSLIDNQYWWIISDQGSGFTPSPDSDSDPTDYLPPDEAESGRGMSLLHLIFDQVEWNRKGTELRLCKQIEARRLLSLRR